MTNRLRRDEGACARWPMLLNPPETVIDDGVKLRVAQRHPVRSLGKPMSPCPSTQMFVVLGMAVSDAARFGVVQAGKA